MKLLNVNPKTLEEFGAVSEETAREMAIGAMQVASSDISVSITGIAGPGGGTKAKPVGMVCFGIASLRGVKAVTHNFSGSRSEIRQRSCEVSLNLILENLII